MNQDALVNFPNEKLLIIVTVNALKCQMLSNVEYYLPAKRPNAADPDQTAFEEAV